MASVVKNLPANAGDVREAGLIPGSGRSLGGGHGNPFQYSCLENPMGRGAWWATVYGVTKSQTQLSAHTHTHTHSVNSRFFPRKLLKNCFPSKSRINKKQGRARTSNPKGKIQHRKKKKKDIFRITMKRQPKKTIVYHTSEHSVQEGKRG